MDALLKQSLEALGLPLTVPEPEVLRRELECIRCTSLAGFIARLLDDDPLLHAQAKGASVTVTDCDGNAMHFTIQGSGGAVNASPVNNGDETATRRNGR